MSLFFKKKMSLLEQQQLKITADEVQVSYNIIFNIVDDPEALMKHRELLNEKMVFLLSLQKKYPSLFKKDTPEQAATQLKQEQPIAEKKFIDRYVLSIERKLLNYKTDRGKNNNLKNSIEKFMYYSSEFLPQSIDYFKLSISKHFPNSSNFF